MASPVFSSARAGSVVTFPMDYSSTTTPVIVQQATAGRATSGTVTFAKPLTPGNILVAIGMGYNGNNSSASMSLSGSGWGLVYQMGSVSYQSGSVLAKTVTAADGLSYTYTAYDPYNVLILELSGASIDAIECSGGSASFTSTTFSIPVTASQGLSVLSLEQDSKAAYQSMTGPASLLYDASSTETNHPSTFWKVTGSGTVAITMSAAPTYPCFMLVNIFGAGGTRGRKAVISSGTGMAMATRPLPVPAYFETYLDPEGASGSASVGIAALGSGVSLLALLGTEAHSLGYAAGGAVSLGNTALASIGAYGSGQYIGVAVDPIAKLAWFRINGGRWNNSDDANPTTGVGGISFSGMTSGPVVPAWSSTAINKCTLLVTSDEVYAPPPDGFTIYEDALPTGFTDAPVTVAMFAVAELPQPYIRSVYRQEGFNPVGTPYGTSQIWSPASPYTSVKGVVQEEDVVVAGKKVFLYDSDTGERIGSAVSGADGSFEIAAKGRLRTHVVALDPNYRALIYDRVIPT